MNKKVAMLVIGGLFAGGQALAASPGKAEPFDAPEGKAAIFVVRDEFFGPSTRYNVAIDDSFVGILGSKTYLKLVIAPGQTEISCKSGKSDRTTLKTEANQVYFVESELKSGMFSTGCAVKQIDNEKGKQAVLNCKKADSVFDSPVVAAIGPIGKRNMVSDSGKGVALGGVATGSPALAVTGTIIDIVGGWIGLRNIDKESPDFKKRMAMSWDRCLKREIYWQNRQMLKPAIDTTVDQIKTQAGSYCASLDKIVAEGGTIDLSRKRLTEEYKMNEAFLPEGDEDKLMYKLTKNPIDNCVSELTAAGERMVERKKKGLD